jgi:hypothetical protein
MTEQSDFGRALLVACDVAGFGAGDDVLQTAKQQGLITVLDQSAAAARLVRSAWRRNDRGDGELALLPSTESEPRVVDDFIHQLYAVLARHNRHLRDDARLRLRVAIHFGVAYPADAGYAGQGIVAVSRLLDCEPLRFALSYSGAELALILSDRVYQDTVVQGHTVVRPVEFLEVRVRVKEFSDRAWLWLPGNGIRNLPAEALGDVARSPEPAGADEVDPPTASDRRLSRAAADATVTAIFEGPVHAEHDAVFGIRIDTPRDGTP